MNASGPSGPLVCVCPCHAYMPVSYSHVVTCLKRADLLALLCVMFSCVFYHDALGQV